MLLNKKMKRSEKVVQESHDICSYYV